MTGILFTLLVLVFFMGCIQAYNEHVSDKHDFFECRETNKFDRFMWRMMAVLKVLFALCVLGGILRLYFIIG